MSTEEKTPVEQPKDLYTALMTETPTLVAKYQRSVSHTQSYLNSSMVYAYQKGLMDAAKFIQQEKTK